MTAAQRFKIYQALLGTVPVSDSKVKTELEECARLDLEALAPIIDEMITEALSAVFKGELVETPPIEGEHGLLVGVFPDGPKELIIRGQIVGRAEIHQFHVPRSYALAFSKFLAEKAITP